ncbi:AbrB/MazE/SpoVT family DNA-binding domain-containing protein [Chelativorans sp. ZYF759]|uniref:AbrB/MazE/SpoVT family DNA-binding domain-containing protein n=1 Tax=Chelativorans sp. ZYF759 TaxID=2692213 RepID=UPI00145F39F1|nr:type II toxin-antitoxin system PrlF family antitoxin [Chelativorans sp. ZYF759]NMG41985.1 AbrB/MazE/SpoVT family DNA-binding domain-containing protein [Chelativorans sp. ZYF759]
MGQHSRLTSKGQTTIPAEVRDYLGLKPGDRIVYAMKDGKVELRAKNLRAVDLIGILGPPPAGPKTLEEIEEGIATAAAESGLRGLE